jgi:hypothetical protein
MLVISVVAMGYVDTSQIYHLVRGQSVIKLYVIFNMLDIFDRLAASIGQDVLDSFYYIISDKSLRKWDMIPLTFYGLIATSYICI